MGTWVFAPGVVEFDGLEDGGFRKTYNTQRLQVGQCLKAQPTGSLSLLDRKRHASGCCALAVHILWHSIKFFFFFFAGREGHRCMLLALSGAGFVSGLLCDDSS